MNDSTKKIKQALRETEKEIEQDLMKYREGVRTAAVLIFSTLMFKMN